MSGPSITVTPLGGWVARAKCGDVDPELFHPRSSNPRENAEQVRAAKAVCAACPVKAECLADAMANGYEGIWGGTTEQQRHGMRPSVRRTRPPTWHERCGSYSGVSRHRKAGESLCEDCRDARSDYEKAQRAKRSAVA